MLQFLTFKVVFGFKFDLVDTSVWGEVKNGQYTFQNNQTFTQNQFLTC